MREGKGKRRKGEKNGGLADSLFRVPSVRLFGYDRWSEGGGGVEKEQREEDKTPASASQQRAGEQASDWRVENVDRVELAAGPASSTHRSGMAGCEKRWWHRLPGREPTVVDQTRVDSATRALPHLIEDEWLEEGGKSFDVQPSSMRARRGGKGEGPDGFELGSAMGACAYSALYMRYVLKYVHTDSTIHENHLLCGQCCIVPAGGSDQA